MLIGFSGWWTPYPKEDERAKKYIGSLINRRVKVRTTRVETPQYQKIDVGSLLHLWWRKRGQPAEKNHRYGIATCISKDHIYIDSESNSIYWGEDSMDLPERICRKFALEDIGTADLNKFFQVFKTGHYVTIRWGEVFR